MTEPTKDLTPEEIAAKVAKWNRDRLPDSCVIPPMAITDEKLDIIEQLQRQLAVANMSRLLAEEECRDTAERAETAEKKLAKDRNRTTVEWRRSLI